MLDKGPGRKLVLEKLRLFGVSVGMVDWALTSKTNIYVSYIDRNCKYCVM
jgi:hypothetical protein